MAYLYIEGDPENKIKLGGDSVPLEFVEAEDGGIVLKGNGVGCVNNSTKEWEIIDEITLDEDTSHISMTGLCLKALDIKIIHNTPLNTNCFLTSSGSGSIYGDPRIQVTIPSNFTGITNMGLEVITPYLWRAYASNPPYQGMGNFAGLSESYCHSITGSVINKPEINEFTLIPNGTSFKAGTVIVIRGKKNA